MPARLDSLTQKVEAASKGEGFAPAPKVDAIDKKVGDLAQAVDALKAELAGPEPGPDHRAAPRPPRRPADVNVEGQAMEQAVDLFKQGKYAEAKDAFARLQAAYPDDARVWYFSALANGLATRDWKGESERLVKVGVAKEKAGSPDKAKIDAAFAGLTADNGKDWLAYLSASRPRPLTRGPPRSATDRPRRSTNRGRRTREIRRPSGDRGRSRGHKAPPLAPAYIPGRARSAGPIRPGRSQHHRPSAQNLASAIIPTSTSRTPPTRSPRP